MKNKKVKGKAQKNKKARLYERENSPKQNGEDF